MGVEWVGGLGGGRGGGLGGWVGCIRKFSVFFRGIGFGSIDAN